VVTKDGFILVMHRIRSKNRDHRPMKPIILQHGLFQSSGIFVANEKESLAFYLADLRYDVWLGNNRGVFDLHTTLQPSDSKYWDWGLDELAKYDFPAMIDYVIYTTGFQKIVYIGHSQGSAQAFAGLSANPIHAEKLDIFIALAPAFYIGDSVHWAVKTMFSLSPSVFNAMFGAHCFLPIMNLIHDIIPSGVFCHLGYPMFSYLFHWGDTYWDRRRKAKYFSFTPRPLSSRLIRHWAKIFQSRQLVHFDPADEKFEKPYSVKDINCPMAIFHGGQDSLVDGRRLIEELQGCDTLMHAEEIPHYEHMDLIWATDAPKIIYSKIADVLLQQIGQQMSAIQA